MASGKDNPRKGYPLLERASPPVQELFHHLRTASFAFDQDGRVHAWNAACEALFGLTAAEALGKPIRSLLSPASKGSMPVAAFVKRSLRGERFDEIIWDIAHADGTSVPVLCYAIPIDKPDGDIEGVICVCIDMLDRSAQPVRDLPEPRATQAGENDPRPDLAVINLILHEQIRERKYAEENLRSIMRASRCLIWNAIVVDEGDQTLKWYTEVIDEEAAQRFLPLEIAPLRWYADALYFSRLDGDRQACDRRFEAAVRSGQGFSQEFRCRRKDGAIRWLTEEVTVEKLAAGRWRVFGLCLDITDRKELEAQLLHGQKLESIGHLAAGIAHEINTPIQYVGDNTRFLGDAFADLQKLVAVYQELIDKAGEMDPGQMQEQARQAEAFADLDYFLQEVPCSIQQSLEGIGRVAAIVQAMKEFSHPGTGEMKPIDLNHAIQSTITVSRNEWKYVAEMATDFDPDLPLISCLPADLNQVFLNVIVNAAHAIAAKYDRISDEKGTINVTTRRDGEWVEIRIADDGVGIPEEDRARIFDPFFTTKDVGAGQGLSLSRTVVVDKHKGSLAVVSEVNFGSTFIIRLPISRYLADALKAA